jgi:hypothetical protein
MTPTAKLGKITPAPAAVPKFAGVLAAELMEKVNVF